MLFGALIAHNEERVNAIFEEVQKYFDLLTIFQEVIAPAMELVGEAWYRGEIRIATEHMASNLIKGRLLNIMQNLPAAKEGALILVGCGPDEGHELAALMFEFCYGRKVISLNTSAQPSPLRICLIMLRRCAPS